MTRAVVGGVMMVLLLIAQTIVAQDLRPQVIPADRTTPRGTLKVLRTAFEEGNVEQIRSILTAGNDVEKAMVDSMARTAESVRKLHTAAVETFGREPARVLTGEAAKAAPDELTDLDRAVETISEDGSSAVVSFEDISIDPVKLQRDGEQWQVPVSELRQLDPQAMPARLAEVDTLIRVLDEVAAEITQKKYASAEEAKQALYDRLVQAALESTTAPTTRPSNP